MMMHEDFIKYGIYFSPFFVILGFIHGLYYGEVLAMTALGFFSAIQFIAVVMIIYFLPSGLSGTRLGNRY